MSQSSQIPHVLAHSPKDNVAVVVVEDLKAGTEAFGVVTEDNGSFTVAVKHDIPIGHKVALTDIKEGDTVWKYGQDIGKAVPTSRRASTSTSTISRPSGGERTKAMRKTNGSITAGGARTAASACAITSIILPLDDLSNAACEAVANNIKGTLALPARLRPPAVRRGSRPAFPHPDRHRLQSRTSPPWW